MRVRTTRETTHSAGWGDRRVLPSGALCVVVAADNLPAESRERLDIDYWASPLVAGKAGGWGDDRVDDLCGSIGVGLSADDFEPIGGAIGKATA